MAPSTDSPALPSAIGMKRTRIIRSRANQRWLVACVAALSIAGALLAASGWLGWPSERLAAWFGASLLWVNAVGVYVGRIRRGTGNARCPLCGAELVALERTGRAEGILCPACKRFLRCLDGWVEPIELDTIAESPVFGAILPGRFTWPPGCAVCGRPATQTVDWTCSWTTRASDLALARATAVSALTGPLLGVFVLARGQSAVRIGVPHCADHDDGAEFEGRPGRDLAVFFRSYPSQRAFCELNSASPVDLRQARRPGREAPSGPGADLPPPPKRNAATRRRQASARRSASKRPNG